MSLNWKFGLIYSQSLRMFSTMGDWDLKHFGSNVERFKFQWWWIQIHLQNVALLEYWMVVLNIQFLCLAKYRPPNIRRSVKDRALSVPGDLETDFVQNHWFSIGLIWPGLIIWIDENIICDCNFHLGIRKICGVSGSDFME